MSVALAYDAIAATYDEQVRGDDWMRQVLHARYRRAFAPGQRVLDVGCGTGIDSLYLASLGVRVTAVDGSAAMMARLRDKVAAADASSLVEARVARIEELSTLDAEPYDGLISAFASLSCVADLDGFAREASRLVRPGGRVILHMLNRFSAWEWLGYAARRDWRSAREVGRWRRREFVIGGESVAHWLYYASDVSARFRAAGFVEGDAFSLGALRPPHTVQRLPARVVAALEWLDVRLGRAPLLKDAGRFFVLELERSA